MYRFKDQSEYIHEGERPNAEKIRRLWQRSGMTIERIAMLVGVKKNTFSNWTMQRREPTNLEMLAVNYLVSRKIGCQTNSDVFRQMKDEDIVNLIKSGEIKDWTEYLKSDCDVEKHSSNSNVLNIDVIRILEDEKIAQLIENAIQVYGENGVEEWLYSPAKIDEINTKEVK